jgi:hypothetical protein
MQINGNAVGNNAEIITITRARSVNKKEIE